MFDEPIAAWGPYQMFYIESMFTICQSARSSLMLLQDKDSPDIQDIEPNVLLDQIQNIVQQAAALSRYFWPSLTKEPRNAIHQKRGDYLRRVFDIADDNPLRDRTMRNALEHFDERIDIYLHGNVAGEFFPNYVGPKPDPDDSVPKFFRAFFTDTKEFTVLNEEIRMPPIIEELRRINSLLIECMGNGTTFGAIDR